MSKFQYLIANSQNMLKIKEDSHPFHSSMLCTHFSSNSTTPLSQRLEGRGLSALGGVHTGHGGGDFLFHFAWPPAVMSRSPGTPW